MALLGEVECRECKVGHALERDEIAFFESVGVIGEKFEQSAHLAVAPQQRQDHDGSDAERPASLEIYARIGFCIVATQQLSACDAFTGQPRTNLQARADRGGARAGAGAADHLASLGQCQRGSRGARDVLGALHQKLQGGFEFRFFESAASTGAVTAA